MPAGQLPDFPWDQLAEHKERAARAPGGIVDLSIGTPVDPTPSSVQDALRQAADAPGYPLTFGTAALRQAVAAWFAERRGVPDLDPEGVLPTIGSKELVAWLPTLLDLGPGDIVGYPSVAYPSYAVGAIMAGAQGVAADSTTAFGPARGEAAPALLWLNSPSNPTGAVLGREHLAKVVAWARERGIIVASDECYAELDWREETHREAIPSTPSILDPQVCGGSHEGLLVAYSLSKQSNMAGYRAAFVAGDPHLISRLTQVRKNLGMMVPAPIQQALIAGLADTNAVIEQKARYARRRAALFGALTGFGMRIDQSEAGLYLWATAGEDCWDTVARFAERGILVAPGSFYGDASPNHVRVAFTATDERIDAAVQRLAGG